MEDEPKIVVEIEDLTFGHHIATITEQELADLFKAFDIPISRLTDTIDVLGATHQFTLIIHRTH